MLSDRKPRSWFHERRPCPLCKGATVYRGHPCGHCHGAGSLPPILARPTVLTMDGETTSTGEEGRVIEGEDYRCVLDDGHDLRHVFGEHRWGQLCDWESTCPAPTPRAKP